MRYLFGRNGTLRPVGQPEIVAFYYLSYAMGRLNKTLAKAKQQQKKPRFNAVEFKSEDLTSEGIQFKVINNGFGLEFEVTSGDRVVPTNFVTGYRRENKPGFNLKKTNKVTNTTKIGVEQNIEKLDWLVVIDTNSSIINNEEIHLGKVCEIIRCLIPEKQQIEIRVKPVTEFVINGRCEKPELVNWKRLIEMIVIDKGYHPSLLIGIVVDSEQDNLEAYNKRLKPIIDEFYLPENFELMYASADASNDTILNQAITYCDKAAKQRLQELKNASGCK